MAVNSSAASFRLIFFFFFGIADPAERSDIRLSATNRRFNQRAREAIQPYTAAEA